MILLEFNELCPSLLKKWMASGQLPNFKRFYDSSDVYVTEADELKAPNLEPWIQWYSMHTGLPFRVHQVFHLTDGPRADHVDIWSALQSHGKKVWNCSSMNARRLTGQDALFLPDPWCDSQEPNPRELAPFARFVAHQVQEYSNKENVASGRLVMEFCQFMLTHGLSADTVFATTTQLLRDFLSGGKTSWQRAAILDRFLFDVFRYYYVNERPDFSTFCINSTAHLQHCYWRHMSPDEFSVMPTPEERDRYANAILFGYKQMDKVIGRFINLAGDDAALVLATALSQQPFLKYEAIGGQHFYRPRKVANFLEMLGLKPQQIEPVMTHQYLLRFGSPVEAAGSREVLSRVTLNGQQVLGFDVADAGSLYVGCEIRTSVDKSASMELGGNLPSTPFFEHFYQIEGVKSGCHHPDGCLWIRLGEHREHAERASLLDVFPTILEYFQVPAQSCIGKSLLPQTGALSKPFHAGGAAAAA
jgi:hypothetical protein